MIRPQDILIFVLALFIVFVNLGLFVICLKNKAIRKYFVGSVIRSLIVGLFIVSNNLVVIAFVGLSEGFEYNFITTNLGFKLSDNFTLSFGGGVYQINDDKWVPIGLDGNEPSNIEFGMNFGINLMLNDNLGVSMKYNLIEPKEEDSGSMSLNGLSFGLVLR